MSLPSRHWQFGKRRALRGPVIVPAMDISVVSLLQALIDLVHQVICCEKPRGCQRGNVVSIMRKVKVFSMFFEEVRDLSISLPLSTLKCFREMYAILQRTKYFLEDYGRDRSLVWLVVQTEEISRQFYVLTQDMASALDEFPLSVLDVPDELMEQVELLYCQVKRAKVFVDKAEEQLCRDVLAVLDEFENKVTPEESNLRRILEGLNLKCAMDCQREEELLEEELRTQNELGSQESFSVINGLIGFIRYCKCVLFGVTEMDFDSQGQPESKTKLCAPDLEATLATPDDFRCPISLDLMREPVIVSTGQTYDRAWITKWIKEGNETCPKTGQKLSNKNLIPNHALGSLISQYCFEHNIPFERPEKDKKSEGIKSTKAALEAAKMTATFLVEKLRRGSFEVKKQVAYELRLLAKCGTDNRACIAEAGAIPLLLPLLSSKDPKAQENAVTALLNLSINGSNKTKIVESGALHPIINVLKSGCNMESRENAAAALYSLSMLDEYKKTIGETQQVFPALVALLRDGTARGKQDAVKALFNLSVFHGNESKVVAAGAVPLLVNLLTDERPDIVDDVIAVLAVLVRQMEGSTAIAETSPIPLLVGLLRSSSSSPTCKENSVAILLALCFHGGDEIVSNLLRLPSLVHALYNLLTSGTDRAKRKSRSLLRIIHNGEPSPSVHNILSSETETPVAPVR